MAIIWLLYHILRIIMGVASMVINIFPIVCVITKSYMRSAASLLVASLAVSDFLHGVSTSIFLPIRHFATSWHYTHPACLAGMCIEAITVFIQLTTFTMLAFERRNSLLFQLNRSKKWSRKTVLVIMILTWIVIAGYNIAMAIYVADIPEGTACNTVSYYPPFFIYIGISLYFTASILISVGYGHIAWIARKNQNQVSAAQTTTQQRKKDMLITKMMALVVGVFFMLYLPFVVNMVTLSPTSPQWHRVLFSVSVVIYDINFWINPFIYAWRDKRFKRALAETRAACHRMCCSCRPLPEGPGSNSTSAEPEVAVIPVTGASTVNRLVARDP